MRGDEASVHVVLDLPDGLTEDDAREGARDRGLLVRTVGDYTGSVETRRHPTAFVLGYATDDVDALVEDAATLCAALRAG